MPAVTDHAIVRYLERVHGIDMDVIRAEILTPVVQLAEGFGCGTVIGKNGCRVMIRDGVVTTIVPKPIRKGRR
ncbi:hypothetical protein GCM10011380_00470 [Sphingomonas metalli]|uniref:Uncharacterized protein n=1 Tax=Sphingomonas metalli TaxID=1779358 RepID=A0A916SUW8_9SPHN|nr:hypothetical protein [Sphingomonas metalli]GGB14969.1 hypothetical protein GCM10011380_00470 [Sphingomonas metalli]